MTPQTPTQDISRMGQSGMGVPPMFAAPLNTASMPVPKKSRRPMLFWTSLIVGLLLMQIGLSSWGMYCATHGKAPIEDDYYNKALHWDADHKGTAK